MVKCVVHYDSASAAGVEDIEVGILDTWATKVRSGECSSVKWSGIDWFVFAAGALMDDAIFEGQVTDVLGCAWTCVVISVDEWVVSWVAEVEFHPFSSWVIVVGMCFRLRLDIDGDAL